MNIIAMLRLAIPVAAASLSACTLQPVNLNLEPNHPAHPQAQQATWSRDSALHPAEPGSAAGAPAQSAPQEHGSHTEPRQ
jgi:hypothetical protein